MTHDDIATIALSFPGATESAHFGKRDFRAPKIFLSLPTAETANLNLTADQQQMFADLYPGEFAPIPNKWGQRGWTVMHLDRTDEATARRAIEAAWKNVAPKKLLDSLK
ncbi:MmcQ/YjbR family DNA-binding protein [Rhizobium sp.]